MGRKRKDFLERNSLREMLEKPGRLGKHAKVFSMGFNGPGRLMRQPDLNSRGMAMVMLGAGGLNVPATAK